MSELAKWLESLPTQTALRQPYGTQTLEEGIIKDLEDITATASRELNRKEVVMQGKPHLLFLPNHLAGCALVEPGTIFCLYDRVVNVREGFSVPLGLRGTVIRIQKAARVEDNVYDVLFDEVFTGGLSLRCSQGRGYRMPGSAMINLTFKECGGKRIKKMEAEKVKPRAVVRPFDKLESGDSQQQQMRRENVWHQNRNKNAPTGQARPQPRQEEAGGRREKEKSSERNVVKGSFPPPPQLLPKPGDNLLQKKPAKNEEPKIKIMTKQNEGNFQNIWQSLSGSGNTASESNQGEKVENNSVQKVKNVVDISDSSTSTYTTAVSDMEHDLKSLLNISGGGQDQPKFVIGGASFDGSASTNQSPSYCRILTTQLTSGGRGRPRYDYINQPGTGLVAAQVS